MSKLKKYSKGSNLMNIKIKYGSEKFSFNLYQEMIVNENTINKEIKEQSTHYAFLSMLQTRLARSRDDTQAEFEKIEAGLYIEFKEEINPNTSREYSKDTVEMLVKNEKKYQEALNKLNKIKDSYRTISSCVKSFEQRKDLIQSLSANIRNNN